MIGLQRMRTVSNHLVYSFSQTTAADKVLYTQRNPYLVEVVLNNEKALNSLNLDMIQSLERHVDVWNKDPELKAVLIKGQGQKAFCAGGDVKTLYEAKAGKGEKGSNLQILDQFFREEYTCDYKLATMKPNLIALWNGIVMGGGVGISIYAPFRIATEKSMFAMPEAKIGLFTDISGGYFLSRLEHNVGLYLGLTSQRLKGKELVKAGLANYYLPSEKVPELEKRLFESNSPNAFSKAGLEILLKELCERVDGHLDHAEEINRFFSAKTIDEVFASLQKEESSSKFAQETLKLLRANSPLSLRVIWEQIKRGKDQDIRDSFIADFRTTQKFMAGTEFFEGVRCVLVDKNDTPKWSHKNTSEVTDAEVQSYFEPMKDKSKELAI